MTTSELKKSRDYSKEHLMRKAKKSRLLADIEKSKADAFTALLSEQGITFSKWINNQIDKEIKGQ
jgi:hypothetical protein